MTSYTCDRVNYACVSFAEAPSWVYGRIQGCEVLLDGVLDDKNTSQKCSPYRSPQDLLLD